MTFTESQVKRGRQLVAVTVTKDYYSSKQIQQGRKLVTALSNAKWGLGDLALEIASSKPLTTDHRLLLKQYADAIDFDYDKLITYRNVSLTFPKAEGRTGRRLEMSWTLHEEMARVENPNKTLWQRNSWTVPELRKYRGKKANGGGPGSVGRYAAEHISAGQAPVSEVESRERKIKIAREVLRDEDLATEAFMDEETWGPGNKGSMNASLSKVEAIKRNYELEHPEEVAHHETFMNEIMPAAHDLNGQSLIAHARRDLIRASEEMAQAGDGSGFFKEGTRSTLRQIVNLAQALLGDSGTSLDEVLSEILGDAR